MRLPNYEGCIRAMEHVLGVDSSQAILLSVYSGLAALAQLTRYCPKSRIPANFYKTCRYLLSRKTFEFLLGRQV